MIDVRKEHPEYVAQRDVWPKYRDLYVGGEQFIRRSGQYLIPRLREPGDVFLERTNRAFYENYIGSIIDWYSATLFRREPALTLDGQDERARQFFSQFAEDCDHAGIDAERFFRRQMIEALVAGRSYIVIDFPDPGTKAKNRAEEDRLGLSRAYLCEYPAESLVNWQRNERGEFDWVVLRTERRVDEPGAGEGETERRWVYYGREEFQVYQQWERKGQAGPVERVKEGVHGLAAQKVVPLVEFSFGEGMWLMNKAASLQLEHFNKSNALGWALTMGLFAMPVVYSDREWKECMGESYYLQLGPQDKFGWTEPEGHVYQVALREHRPAEAGDLPGVLRAEPGDGPGAEQHADHGGEQAAGLPDHAGGAEGVRRPGEGHDEEGAAGGWDGAGGRDRDRRDGAGRVRHRGVLAANCRMRRRCWAWGSIRRRSGRRCSRRLAMKYLCDVRQEVKEKIAREIDASPAGH